MWYTVEIIKKIKPKYIIWENVKNVLSDKHKHNFDKYLEILRDSGYKNHSKVINAKHWGIPQNRERVFVVSIREDINKDFKFPISSLEGQQSLFNTNVIDIEPKILADILENEVDEKYYIDDDKTEQLLHELNGKKIGVNPCITPDRLDKRQNGRRFKENNEEMFTITGQDRHGVLQIDKLGNIYPSNGQNGEIYNNKGIAPTLQTKSSSSFRILIDYRIKRLTPLECWRLMGFKDNDYWKARKALEEKYYNGKDRSNSQMYKMSGNSIVVNVLEYIFEELFKDKLQKKVS